MKLLVDAGNTRIKWQLREGSEIRLAGSATLESGDLFEGITRTEWQDIPSISVSTVRSEHARIELERVIKGYTATPVRFFWTRSSFGRLTCAYEDPSAMGADRWHALVGAWHEIQGACAVVDAGSAITIDWIDAGGQHLGGYILPGRTMMTDSLRQGTARVLFDAGQAEGISPGQTTAECVFHGVNWLTRALAEQLGRDLAVPVLITGGDGSLIKTALDNYQDSRIPLVALRPDLVLDGLALVGAE
ncbi:type III pantothenate kinase [Marinobacter lacisalsi]|uniref:Type III pantothenate kinase n=1 Tax=Marinobacter lacisalsi TaxID=475979 RepID=A0ABV8QIA7_9GAMM